MQNNVNRIFFALLRASLAGSLSEEERALWRSEWLPSLYALSRRHEVTHLLGYALEKEGLLGELSDAEAAVADKLRQAVLLSAYQCERLDYELREICLVLEEARIAHIPLKGAVLRAHYPEPWMRNSCDVDILVHREDLPRAIELLVSKKGYRKESQGAHDVSLYAPSNVHLELHYELVEKRRAGGASSVLSRVWETSRARNGFDFCYEMCDEMFYFYHMAHMAKHVEWGGCGVRPFLDLWVLRRRMEPNGARRDALLEEGRLLTFERAACRLYECWLEGAPLDDGSLQFQEYVLSGGVYGTEENCISVQQSRRGGKFGYLTSRVFLGYDRIWYQFPRMGKHRCLVPVMNVCRWLRLIFKGGIGASVGKMKINQSISDEQAKRTAELLRRLGL